MAGGAGSDAGLLFLGWYRTGLAAAVTAPAGGAALDTAPPSAVVVPVATTIGDPDNQPGSGDTGTGTVQVRLHAPGDVSGLDAAQIIRAYPAPGATNAPPDCFPLIEFVRPDIPWMLSPTGPQLGQPADADPRRGLTPWLGLVAVEEPPAVLAPPPSAGALPTLTVPDTELPDLATAFLYAHAQVTILPTDTQDVPGLVSGSPERALSRLLAPRYLKPSTPYLACVVPTFAPPDGAATLGPAWRHSTPPAQVTLPVYYYWRFTTGPAVDFRSLVLSLTHWEQGGVGIRPLDIGDAGPGMPAPASGASPWLINLEGVLISGDVAGSIGAWPDQSVRTQIQDALATALDAAGGELTPPVYGATQASFRGPLSGDASSATAPAWLSTLNLDPRYRAAAQAGAALVRANQDAMILSAWDQSGQARAANQVLRQGQLARELGNSTYARRVGVAGQQSPPLDDDRLLQLTLPVHGQIAAPASAASPVPAPASAASTVADALAANPAVGAVLSVPFRRLASPAGPLASRLSTGLLAPPVTSVGTPGGIAVTPPVTPVTGMVDLTGVTLAGAAPETLRSLTGQRVAVPRLPWEGGGIRPTASTDLLVQPGYLSDLWVVGSAVGRALDWDGGVLAGWTPGPPISGFTQGTAQSPGGMPDAIYFPPNVTGGAASLISWNVPGAAPYAAVALAEVSMTMQTISVAGGADYMCFYSAYVRLVLRADLLPDAGGAAAGEAELMSDTWGPISFPLPSLTLAAAVAAGDLTGTGNPSVAMVWSLPPSEESQPSETGVQVRILVDVQPDATSARTIVASVPGTSGDVQSAALANGRLYIMIGGQLVSAAADAAQESVGAFTANTGWLATQPDNWVWATVSAADFTGTGQADLLFCYGIAVPGAEGSAAYRAAYRIGYEPDGSGEPAYWGDEMGAPIPVTDVPASVIIGPVNAQASVLRQAAAQAFRTAAAATQTRMASVIPAAPPAPPPPVDVTALAGTVRAAVDPRLTVNGSVTAKITPAPTVAAGADPLQQLGFTPAFPQPFYQTVRDGALPWLVPGRYAFPDNAVTVLAADSRVVEAMLAGANDQLSRELLWRGVPAVRTGTFFSRFWDGRDPVGAPLADITDIAGWAAASDLGTHAPAEAAPGDAAVLLVRGDLIRLIPDVTLYAAPAVSTAGGGRTVDLTQRVDPVFSGTIDGDSAFAGFPFSVQAAMSSAAGPGMYFVFAEHPLAPRFGLNLVPGTPAGFGGKPDAWRDLDWSGTVRDQPGYDALTYLDASAASPLWGLTRPDNANAAATAAQHRWGFSSAHMANITYRPHVLIAIHADDLLASAGGS